MTEELTYSATTQNTRSILPAGMISVEEARERILEHFTPLDAASVPLLEARLTDMRAYHPSIADRADLSAPPTNVAPTLAAPTPVTHHRTPRRP